MLRSNPCRRQSSPQAQPGQAMVEYLIVLPSLLLLVLGTLQFAFIWQAKITLNYAAFEAVRAGTLNQAQLDPMQKAFARGLAPLFTHPTLACDEAGVFNSNTGSSCAIRMAKREVTRQINNGYVRIQVVNPSPASFLDHGKDLDGDGLLEIPNDNLMFRDAAANIGASQQSIQDANLLKIHVSYCFELHVPVVNRLLVRMMTLAPTAITSARSKAVVDDRFNLGPPAAGSFASTCLLTPAEGGRLGFPIYAQGIMRMQTPPEQPPPVTP